MMCSLCPLPYGYEHAHVRVHVLVSSGSSGSRLETVCPGADARGEVQRRVAAILRRPDRAGRLELNKEGMQRQIEDDVWMKKTRKECSSRFQFR